MSGNLAPEWISKVATAGRVAILIDIAFHRVANRFALLLQWGLRLAGMVLYLALLSQLCT